MISRMGRRQQSTRSTSRRCTGRPARSAPRLSPIAGIRRDNTLTASSARGDIFKVVVDDGNDANPQGAYTFTLLKPVLHAPGDGENDASFDLTYQVINDEDEAATGTLSVIVDDDTPVTAPPASLIVNGDFVGGTFNGEGDFPNAQSWGGGGLGGIDTDGIEGWTVAGGQVERVGTGYLGMFTADGASPMIDMAASPGNISLTQTLPGLTAGGDVRHPVRGRHPGPSDGCPRSDLERRGRCDDQSAGRFDGCVQHPGGTALAGSNTLTFNEIGDNSSVGVPEGGTHGHHGTYLANVSLTASAVVDEDGLTPVNSFGNADGVGMSTQIGDAPTNSRQRDGGSRHPLGCRQRRRCGRCGRHPGYAERRRRSQPDVHQFYRDHWRRFRR